MGRLRGDDGPEEDDEPRRRTTRKRRRKRESALKDHQSTGRKRAARLYPLQREQPCQWQSLANCGGGKSPILGCLYGMQTDRHHGPDKTVTNNDEGNVWLICAGCHHEWHAKNDPEYDWNNPVLTPHNPRQMTDHERSEALLRDARRQVQRTRRIRD